MSSSSGSTSGKTIIAFDLYGTLLSTESVARELASHFGDDKARSIAALWRRFQLEYTWRLNSMSLYRPFSEITQAALQHALAEHSAALSEMDIASLMKAYNSLGTYPDVEIALKELASDELLDAYVFSNGTHAMVSSSVRESPALSPHAMVFKGLVSVQEVEAYKPDPRVYHHLAKEVGKTTSKEDLASIWLVSGNPFDVVGARAVGMQAAWVDRTGGHHGKGGWTDRLGDLASGGPTVVVKGADEAVTVIRKWVEEHASRTPS